jgi:hypothetical protein
MEKGPYMYELFSIMVHSGSASGGHYYAYIKDFKKGDWFCFNDQSVSRVSEFLSSSGLQTHSSVCTVSSVSWLALPVTLSALMLNNFMKSMGPYFYTCFCVRGIHEVPCLVVPAYNLFSELPLGVGLILTVVACTHTVLNYAVRQSVNDLQTSGYENGDQVSCVRKTAMWVNKTT